MRYQRVSRNCVLFAVLFLAIPLVQAGLLPVGLADLTGMRTSSDPSQIVATPPWDGGDFELSWRIMETSPGVWHYSYTVVTANRDLSHWILQVSPTFTAANIWDASESFELDGWPLGHPSNPGIPGPIYGLKWDPGNSIHFMSDRLPVWGNFYAKDGRLSGADVYAHNAGFLWDWDLGNPASLSGFIPIPDTLTQVPEPATILLLGIAVAALGTRMRSKLARPS